MSKSDGCEISFVSRLRGDGVRFEVPNKQHVVLSGLDVRRGLNGHFCRFSTGDGL